MPCIRNEPETMRLQREINRTFVSVSVKNRICICIYILYSTFMKRLTFHELVRNHNDIGIFQDQLSLKRCWTILLLLPYDGIFLVQCFLIHSQTYIYTHAYICVRAYTHARAYICYNERVQTTQHLSQD